MRASPSSVPEADVSLPRPAEGAFVRGLKGASLRRSARMRSASAARELLGRALLSLNCLHSAEELSVPSDSLPQEFAAEIAIPR